MLKKKIYYSRKENNKETLKKLLIKKIEEKMIEIKLNKLKKILLLKSSDFFRQSQIGNFAFEESHDNFGFNICDYMNKNNNIYHRIW